MTVNFSVNYQKTFKKVLYNCLHSGSVKGREVKMKTIFMGLYKAIVFDWHNTFLNFINNNIVHYNS